MMSPKDLYLKMLEGLTYEDLAEEEGISKIAVRSKVQRFYNSNDLPPPSKLIEMAPSEQFEILSKMNLEEEEQIPHSSVKINGEGDRIVTTILNSSVEELSDTNFLLEELGLNPKEWTLKSATLSKWGREGTEQSSVRVQVSPIEKVIDYEKLFKSLATTLEKHPVEYRKVVELNQSEDNLVIPLFDLHVQKKESFYFSEYFAKISKAISRGFKNVIFIFGGDGLEHDNFISTTEQGTRIDDTDIVGDYSYLFKHLNYLIEVANKFSKDVSFIYVRGNHSPSLDWAISHALKEVYSEHNNIFFDIDKDSLVKGIMVDKVFIGMYHGHKSFKKGGLVPSFITAFPTEWSSSSFRLILSGHYHTETETLKDLGSATHHQQPSPKPPNTWAKQNNYSSHFVGSKLYVLGQDRIKEIIYV